MSRTVIVGLADLHCGHSLGLLSPDTELKNETGIGYYKPQSTDMQKYLWGIFLEDVESIREMAGKSPVVLVLLGDWMQGEKHPEQLMTQRLSDQIKIAAEVINPIMRRVGKVERIRAVMSTPAHDPLGALTLAATELLRKEHKIDTEATIRTVAKIGKFSLDFSHKGPHPGGRAWLDGNIVRYKLTDMMLKDLLHGKEPPRVYWRAHRHEYRHERKELYGIPDRVSDLFILPPYCGMGYWAAQNLDPEYLTNGMVALEVIDGELAGHKTFKRTIDVRLEETW